MAYDPRNRYPQPWQQQSPQPGQGQPAGQDYHPQQPYPSYSQQPWPAIQVTQQVGLPGRAVTRRPLGVMETCFHLFMTVATGGLWGFVWWARVRSRRSYTTFR